MLDIEIVQVASGWSIRYKVENQEWAEATEVGVNDLGNALKALGDNLPELIVEAQG